MSTNQLIKWKCTLNKGTHFIHPETFSAQIMITMDRSVLPCCFKSWLITLTVKLDVFNWVKRVMISPIIISFISSSLTSIEKCILICCCCCYIVLFFCWIHYYYDRSTTRKIKFICDHIFLQSVSSIYLFFIG
jgi:hypothetical protein